MSSIKYLTLTIPLKFEGEVKTIFMLCVHVNLIQGLEFFISNLFTIRNGHSYSLASMEV